MGYESLFLKALGPLDHHKEALLGATSLAILGAAAARPPRCSCPPVAIDEVKKEAGAFCPGLLWFANGPILKKF
jgi:hypothetical protein